VLTIQDAIGGAHRAKSLTALSSAAIANVIKEQL
jgi:hypothetical protein